MCGLNQDAFKYSIKVQVKTTTLKNLILGDFFPFIYFLTFMFVSLLFYTYGT